MGWQFQTQQHVFYMYEMIIEMNSDRAGTCILSQEKQFWDSYLQMFLRVNRWLTGLLSSVLYDDKMLNKGSQFPIASRSVCRIRRSFNIHSLLSTRCRLNPYTVWESYLVRGSFGENKCKSRSRKVINKICAYFVGFLTPRLPSLHLYTILLFFTVWVVLKRSP